MATLFNSGAFGSPFGPPVWLGLRMGQIAPEIASQPAEARTFPGSLIGYRHFKVCRVGERLDILSPAYPFPWQDGENLARCANLGGYEAVTLDVEIKRQERHESRLAERARSSRRTRTYSLTPGFSREFWDVAAGDDVWHRISYDSELNNLHRELEATRNEIARLKAIREEREAFDRGEHRLKHCSCGFYASFSPKKDFYYQSMDQHLHGVVESYGKIVTGTLGFRAQKLRILALAPYQRTIREYDDEVFFTYSGTSHVLSRPLAFPVGEMAKAAQKKFPGARWFNEHEEMLAEYPEPDRSGIVADRDSDYGM